MLLIKGLPSSHCWLNYALILSRLIAWKNMSVRLLNTKILNRHNSNERLENGGRDHPYSTLHDDGEGDEKKAEDDDSSQLTDDLTGEGRKFLLV